MPTVAQWKGWPHTLIDYRWREVFLLTASLLHEATPLFEAMQAAAQDILDDNRKLLTTQVWTAQRGDRIPAYKGNAKRILYWYISLSRDLSLDLDSTLDLARGLNLVRAYDLSHDLARNLGRDFDLTLDLTLDLARTRNRDLELDLSLDRDLELDRVQGSLSQAPKGLENFLVDLNASSLVLLANIFTLLPQKERSKKRVEKFQAFFTGWQEMPENPLDSSKMAPCPLHRASNQEWQKFRNSIKEMVENLLEVNLSIAWNLDDYSAALAYINANQLFWDCLQVASVENRDAIEDMILAPPKDNK